jgi:hypothetical protein
MAYRIRLMEPRDVPAVQALHDAQNARDHTSYPLTQVFDESFRRLPNVALALVVLDGAEIKQGVVFETSVEMMLSGCDPKATAELHNQIGACFDLLREKGFTSVNCWVPKAVVLPVEKPLKKVGFERDDFRMAHFLKDLREQPEGTENE